MATLFIVVFWCLSSTPLDSFNPHQVDAAQKFWAANRATCGTSPAEEISGPASVADCRSWAFVHYQPDWLSKAQNRGRLYLHAECFERWREPLDLEAMKRRVSP